MDDPTELRITQLAGALLASELRIAELERILRHFDASSMDLHRYVQSVDGLPDAATWQLVIDQIAEMVNADGPRNPNR